MIFSTKKIFQMTRFTFKLSLLGLMTLSLTHCMRHKTHDPKVKASIFIGDNADFDLAGTEGRILENQVEFQNLRAWKVPLYQTYSFQAEVRDASSRNTLRDFPFAVLDEDGNEICQPPEEPNGEPTCRYTANAASKIVWVERIPYDHFKGTAEPVNIIRKIKGLGARRGVRTAILQLNPWAPSRKLPNPFRDVTFELTEDTAKPLVNPGYRSSTKFRFQSEDDSSELVVRNITKQLYGTVEPILVSRSDKDLEALEEDLEADNLIFSPFEPTEFFTRRESSDKKLDEVEAVSEITKSNNRVYVYRKKDQRFPEIDGLKFDFTVLMNLGFRYPDLSSGFGITDITAGRFRVAAHLVLEPSDGAQPILLTPGVRPLMAEISRNNDLQLDYKPIIPFYPSTGIIKLAIKVSPQGIQGLKPVDRLFTVGVYNTLIGKNGALIEDETSRRNNFNYDEYIKASVSGEKAYADGQVDVARDYHFDDLAIRFSTVEAGETAAQRTVIFKVETRVFDEVSGQMIGDNVPFEVVSIHTDYNHPEDKSKWKIHRITNPKDVKDPARSRRGLITWYDTITHKYYQTEELVDRNIFIARWQPGFDLKKIVEEWVNSTAGIPDEKTLPKSVQKLKIYINPWDEKFGTFGQDARIASESFLEKVRGREKIAPRFSIGDYGYETLRFRYKIDKDMKLIVKKTVLLNLKPVVLRYSSILEGINSIYNLRDGVYLMKVALQKDYLDPSARNEADILQIPFDLPGETTDLLNQQFDETGAIEGAPPLVINGANGDSKVEYDGQTVTNQYDDKGNKVSSAHSIPYGDPRRKQEMSMVKKLVRVNAGRVITPVEFSVEDLRLMRIRQQFFVQLEPINQVRLQMVELVRERFEEIFQIKLGQESPVLGKMSLQDQSRVKRLMTDALDAMAMAVSDDIYVTKIEDLSDIINDPKVVEAFKAFDSANFMGTDINHVLKDILRDLKTQNVKDRVITDDDVKKLQDQREQDLEELRKEHDEQLKTLEDIKNSNTELAERKSVFEKECPQVKASEVYLDPNTKTTTEKPNLDPVTRAMIPFTTGIFPDDYNDQVSKFQPFEGDAKQFFSSIVSKDSLNKILTNDFTLAPAFSALSDLDLLLDTESGIEGRTFVGPMTFLYNTNRGSLRPTDNLDEAYCETDDCNSLNTSIDSQYGEIQNYDYEKSKYHGSIAHFQGVTFDDKKIVDSSTGETKIQPGLETMFKNLEVEKRARRRVESFLTRFLDHFDMSYVSLTDKPIDRLVCTSDIMSDKCVRRDTEKTVLVDDYLREYTKTVNEVVNLNYLNSPNIEIEFQEITNGYSTGDDVYYKFKGDRSSALPWGFVSPVYEKGMERCSLRAPELEMVCSEANESKRLGGLLGSSYEKDVAYLAPTKEELSSIIRYPFKGKEMVSSEAAVFDSLTQSKLCDLLVYGEIARKGKNYVKSDADKLKLRKETFDLSRRCQVDIENGLNPLVIERKFRIFETGRYYFLGGKSMNINASQYINLGTALRVSRNFGSRPLRIITGIIEKGRSFFSNALALVVGSFDFSYSIQRDRSYTEGTGIMKGTYLVMQNAEFEIELTSYEQCLTLRWDPAFVEKYSKNVNFIDGAFSEAYIVGLYLCSGVVEETPIAVNEKYYYFTQHFTEGDMLDPADIHNHPWLLALRGVREFSAFMLALQSFEKVGDKYSPEYVKGEEMVGYFDFIGSDAKAIQDRVKGDPNRTKQYDVTPREEWPIHQMVSTYQRVLPTFPGVYSQLDSGHYYDRSWPWEVGPPGTVMRNSKECPQ